MTDQPSPTEGEEEQAPTERQVEEEEMRQSGHGDPERRVDPQRTKRELNE